jgi:hypothetical protein
VLSHLGSTCGQELELSTGEEEVVVENTADTSERADRVVDGVSCADAGIDLL